MDELQEVGYFANDTATFGDRVQAAREGFGLTQQDLARKLGVKLKTVRGWEEDLSEPRANKLQMLAGLLNVSMMWLLTGEGDGLTAPVDTPALPTEANDLLMDMRKTQSEMKRLSNHVGALEKRLARLLVDG